MGKIANGFELTKQSWSALRQNPQLLMFPVISTIGLIIVSILFFIPTAALGIPDALSQSARAGESTLDSAQTLGGAIILFLYYFVTYTVIIFSNVALVGAAMKLIRGEPATVSDGIQIAMARLPKILVYALISATVGMLARALRDSGRRSENVAVAILTAIVAAIVQGAWNLAVFFAVPILVVEDVGVIDSLKRSIELFKRTWGEGFVGSTAIGLASCLLTLAVILVGGGLIILAVQTGSLALVILMIVLVVIAVAFVSMINGALNGIFQASLYQYATTGDAGRFISTDLARSAFMA